MTIVTNHMRGQIVNAVLKHAFAEKLGAFLDTEQALADKLYAHVYSAAEIAAMDVLEKRHKNGLHSCSGFGTNVRGMSIQVGERSRYDGKGDDFIYILPRPRELRYRIIEGGGIARDDLTFAEGDALGDEVFAYAEGREALNEEIKTRRAEITGVLSDIRTDRQLSERWPEVVPIAAEFIVMEPKVKLPMVPLTSLNAALGLPVELAEAA